ncbi:MAG TPA: hypothetical protein VGD37_32740 [Kofleriaceae bacterium]
MIAACLVLATGCPGPGSGRPPPVDPGEAPHSALADEDSYKPGYGKAELQKALIADRAAEATLERRVAELEARDPDPRDAAAGDQLRVAAADLAVRRRFIATLEACESAGRWCPPRLDDPAWAFDPDADPPADPPLTATLRFDLESWRAIAAELHGRACACRTLACLDSVGVAIDQLERRPMPEVQSDDAAVTAVTRARECLFRLRGRSGLRVAAPVTDERDE